MQEDNDTGIEFAKANDGHFGVAGSFCKALAVDTVTSKCKQEGRQSEKAWTKYRTFSASEYCFPYL
jgi:hypothetical protein